MWIVELALSRPYTFIVLALVLILISTVFLLRTPVDIFPNINIPVISVIWNYTGVALLVGYLDVLVAQTTLLSNQRTVAQISGQRMVATVVLVKTLGGGWLGVPAPPQLNPNNQTGDTATN